LPDSLLWKSSPTHQLRRRCALARSPGPWRSLGLSSGVINLDSCSYSFGPLPYNQIIVFLGDANAAIRAFAEAEGSDLNNDEKTYYSWC
jgi:hypothetical protein